MTRTAWIVIIAVVVAAVVIGAVGIVAVATHHHDGLAAGPRAMLGNGGGAFGHGDGFGAPGRGDFGLQHGASIAGRGGRGPLYGLPWLAAGLLIGLCVTVLAWQPWKRPALLMAGGATADDAGAPDASQQWAQWHRDVHAAEETTQRMTPGAAVTEVTGQAPAAEPAAEEASDAAEPAVEAAQTPAAEPAGAAPPVDDAKA